MTLHDPEFASCWLASLPGAGPCDGRLVRCHLIPRQLLRREGFGAFVDDPRTWVWGCGGAVGISGHHGALDTARSLRIPRGLLPSGVEDVARELGLGWWLDREYGPRSVDVHIELHVGERELGDAIVELVRRKRDDGMEEAA